MTSTFGGLILGLSSSGFTVVIDIVDIVVGSLRKVEVSFVIEGIVIVFRSASFFSFSAGAAGATKVDL